jgi:hypothetical protein
MRFSDKRHSAPGAARCARGKGATAHSFNAASVACVCRCLPHKGATRRSWGKCATTIWRTSAVATESLFQICSGGTPTCKVADVSLIPLDVSLIPISP